MPDQRRELARRLNSATVHLMRSLRDASSTGLAAEHQSVLTAVVFGGPIAIGELARREGVGAPAMTKAVGVLEHARLVRRRRDARDARVVTVAATAAGRRLIVRGRDARVVRITAALRQLERADLRELERAMSALERLVADLERPRVRRPDTLVRGGRARPVHR